MKRNYLLFILFLAFPVFLPAQSTAQDIEELLRTNAVTNAQAMRFILQAADLMTNPDLEEAFCYVSMNKWLPRKIRSGGTARLDIISLLLMRSFEINGGLMYSATGNAHFAYCNGACHRICLVPFSKHLRYIWC
jgi:hypothetical protein